MKPHNDAARDYQPLLLLRNISYPTYQLHAIAGKGKSTPPKTVFKITVLETMKWLRQRFRAFELPSELNMPEPEAYEELDLSRLSSFHLDMGYKLQVFWLPDKGIWTLQLTEPDLGTNPGAADQGRMPVPGRLFETNISYSIITDGVECGFRTVVHEIQGTDSFCEVFRLAVIKYLARNPRVGLWQTWQLIEEAHALSNYADIKRLRNWLVEPERMLPAVVFSEYEQMSEAPIPCVQRMDMQQVLSADKARYRGFTPTICPPIKNQDAKPSVPLDISSLTRYRMGCAQFFILPASQRESFIKTTGRHIGNGDILIIEPAALGGQTKSVPYGRIEREPGKVIKELDFFVQNYPKGKAMSFGKCVFVPEAQALEREAIIRLHRSREQMAASFIEQKAEIESRCHQKLSEYAEKIDDAEKRIERLKARLNELEEEKKAFIGRLAEVEGRYKRQLDEKEEQILHLKMLRCRPQKPSEVAAWIEKWFEGRLMLHERAKDMIGRVQPGEVDMPLLCDALEYLAVEYRNELIGLIDEATRDNICSKKYNRPFEVVPTKGTSVEMYPADYKIKYYIGYRGIPVESVLDLHLKVGKDPSDLLRIYFLYDKEKKLIVVGSLPKHLRVQSYK